MLRSGVLRQIDHDGIYPDHMEHLFRCHIERLLERSRKFNPVVPHQSGPLGDAGDVVQVRHKNSFCFVYINSSHDGGS